MKSIYCQNIIIVDGKKTKCHRWLGQLSDLQIDILKIDPEAKAVFRCPQCHSEQRFVEIKYSNNELVFEATNHKPNNAEELKFDTVNIYEEVS